MTNLCEPCLASTFVSGVGTLGTESLERLEFAFFGGDFAWRFGDVAAGNGQGKTSGLELEILGL